MNFSVTFFLIGVLGFGLIFKFIPLKTMLMAIIFLIVTSLDFNYISDETFVILIKTAVLGTLVDYYNSKYKVNKVEINPHTKTRKSNIILDTLRNYKLHINIWFTLIYVHFTLYILYIFNKNVGGLILEYVELESLLLIMISNAPLMIIACILIFEKKNINFFLEKLTIGCIKGAVRITLFCFFSTIYYFIFDIEVFNHPISIMLILGLDIKSCKIMLYLIKNNIYKLFKHYP